MKDSEKIINDLIESGQISVKEVISESLNHMGKYEKDLLSKRNGLIWNACNFNISFILDSKKFQKMKTAQKIAFLIDMLFYLYPKDSEISTTAIKNAVDLFKKWCCEINILQDKEWVYWLKDIKSREHYDWVVWLLNKEEL